VNQQVEGTSSIVGVADIGYNWSFFAIAKRLNDNYLRLLGFEFHTLIQERLKVSDHTINGNNLETISTR
jgi:hypothetical protein